MRKTICKYTKITAAIVMGVALNQTQLARAGWKGAMNGTGFGQASVNVVSVEETSRTVTTTNMQNPSVAMITTSGYVFGAPLPSKSSPATVAKVKGSTGYVWQNTTIGSNGDSTDNPELESRINIIAADCASLEMTSSSDLAPDEKSGTITVKAKATAGTALWLRGIEYFGDPSTLPPDLEETEANETIEFLKANGALKWDVLLVGPFDLQTADCDSIKIPFTIDTDPSHLYFVSDGVAKSLPLVITCPSDILVTDKEPVTYPPTVIVGGCGDITVTFNPPAPAGGSFAPGVFPVGTTPVTVTATDKDGNTKTCTFNVVVTDTTAPVIIASGTPADGVLGINPTSAQIEAALGSAEATDNGGDVTPNAETGSVSVNGCTRSQTRTWTVTDAAGNAATPVSRTATWTVDTAPPVIVASGTPANGALGFNPTESQINAALGTATATDNCGPVTPSVVTSGVTTIGCARAQTRTWTVTDAAGNSATPVSRTAAWTVDTTPPAIPSLPTVTGTCGASVTLPLPTTTDSCGGTVTVSPNAPQTFTTPGTNRVQWTFTDAAGNTSTAYQTGIVASLTFTGFYSPINGTGGTCAAPLIIKCANSTLPIKFDMKCGTTPITGGTPPVVRIQAYDANCAAGAEIVVQNAVYQNDWHYNWNVSNRINGTYKITVVLPDGTSRFVFVKLK